MLKNNNNVLKNNDNVFSSLWFKYLSGGHWVYSAKMKGQKENSIGAFKNVYKLINGGNHIMNEYAFNKAEQKLLDNIYNVVFAEFNITYPETGVNKLHQRRV